MTTFTSESARIAGRKGGRPRKLTLDHVERELGRLETITDAQRWLRCLALWGASGLLSGVATSSCVRACDIFLKSLEHELTAEVADGLRKRVESLEAELRQRQRAQAV